MKLLTTLKTDAERYLLCCKELPHLLHASGKQMQYFIGEVGITKANFYIRLRENNWTPAHLELFYYLLNEEEPPQELRVRLGQQEPPEDDLFRDLTRVKKHRTG